MKKLLSLMGIITVLTLTLGISSQTDVHQIEVVASMMADGDHGG
ncbi:MULTISPECIES: hypothetical protein [Bacillus]|nr:MULTISPECIES: hypothetical protein [Bacillus cereus group]EOP60472.1 hypothetical protein IIW_04421 [Bacillus cereus VD136]EOP70708.1 hypothetical protein KOW_04871 [Bacillus cereus VDM006]EOQ05749.1 hypothetical protein KOY_04030 [Bacillus cereus VDM021]OOG91567.1 hypothetical protein BTH41_01339 [Bacillus mycoides]MDF2085302.1 hypothetical protein [Bacillus pseudomycoides]